MQGGWDAIAQLRGDGLHRNSRLAEARAVHYYATFAERGQWFKENAPDLNFGFTSWPKPEGGKDANLGGNHTVTFAINAPNPDAMFAWFKYFLSADTNLRFAKQYDRVPVREASRNCWRAGTNAWDGSDRAGGSFASQSLRRMPHGSAQRTGGTPSGCPLFVS